MIPDYEASVRVAGYTVMYNKNEPQGGLAVVDLPDNRRSIVYTEDIMLMNSMEREGFCGRVANINDARSSVFD